MNISSKKNVDIVEVRRVLMDEKLPNMVVQYLGSMSEMVIKFKTDKDSDVERVKDVLKNFDFIYHQVDFIGPQVTKNLVLSGILAVVSGILGIFFYLWFRFNTKFAIAGVVGIIHDAVIPIIMFIFSVAEFNISSIAAILTIIGYSVNDSVVIFDMVRKDNIPDMPAHDLINLSVSKTMSRTVFTTITTLISSLSLVMFCSGEIQHFAMLITFGVIIGTYSSIFICAPLLVLLWK